MWKIKNLINQIKILILNTQTKDITNSIVLDDEIKNNEKII